MSQVDETMKVKRKLKSTLKTLKQQRVELVAMSKTDLPPDERKACMDALKSVRTSIKNGKKALLDLDTVKEKRQEVREMDGFTIQFPDDM